MKWIFWGLVVIHLDLYGYSWDFLPDIIGFALVFVGAGQLRTLGRPFVRLRTLSAVLGVLSLVPWLVTGLMNPSPLTAQGCAVDLADSALVWVLEGCLIYAVAQAERTLHTELDDAALPRAYVVCTLLTLAGALLRWLENDIFAVLTAIATGLALVWLLYAVRQVGKNYGYVVRQQAFQQAAGQSRTD